MNISLSRKDLKNYVSRQLDNFFPDDYKFQGGDVDTSLDTALERLEYCFKFIAINHYTHDGQTWFSHLHSDQYSAFLYFLSNSLWKQSENKPLCDKLVLLNKALNAIFLSYKCDMPDIFYLSHPVGTVLGNAEYSDFLCVLHNVTVNTSYKDGTKPKIGKGVFLSAGVSVIGNKNIGDFCSIGANSLLYNIDIPENSIAFTDSNGMLRIKPNKKECYAQQVFNVRLNNEV